MNVIGIVCEYNPFHNGHIYQINKIKEMYKDSIIIVALSSNYTMRGEISVLDKWTKTKLCLDNNIDIVLELPYIYASDSADTYSKHAIRVLNDFKIDTLVFGSESASLDKLLTISKVQLDNNEFDNLVKEYMSLGLNYPTSLGKAIYKLTNLEIKDSNDILGVSYIKEILKNNYNINIVPIKRTNNYKNNPTNSNIISAYQIREYLKQNKSVSKYIPYDEKYLRKIDYNLLFNLIKYKVISEKEILSNYHLVNEGIEKRIYNSILKVDNYEDLVKEITNKRITINKVNRILTNIFVGYTKKERESIPNYIKILGLSKKGSKYYKDIKKDINTKVYTKFEKDIMNTELKTSYLYSIITNDNTIFKSEIINHTITK